MITVLQRYSETDRQTDRQTTCRRKTALCLESCGKKAPRHFEANDAADIVSLCDLVMPDCRAVGSESTLIALLAARSKAVTTAKQDGKTTDGHILSNLVAYCSDEVTKGRHKSHKTSSNNLYSFKYDII